MRQTTQAKRQRTLRRLIGFAEALLLRSQRISRRLSWWRLGIFLVGAACAIIPYRLGWYHTGNAALVIFVLIFLVVARYHNRLESRMQRLQLWRDIKRAHLARLRLDWNGIPHRESPVDPVTLEGHPYARDLDLIGPYSLFRLMDTTISSHGRERLGTWLLNQDALAQKRDDWRQRQELVKELAGLPLFRDRLLLEATAAGEEAINADRIRTMLQAPVGFPMLLPVLIVEGLLATATLVLAVGAILVGTPDYWNLSLTVYIALYLATMAQTARVFTRAMSLHGELERLAKIFRYLEARSYQATPVLASLCAPLIYGTHRPSAHLHRLARVTHALSIRAHPIVHLLANALMPWDLFFTYRLERIRVRALNEIPGWLDTLGSLEAAAALGNFAYLNPESQWPTLLGSSAAENGQPAALLARGLGHPLISAPERVTNDLELRGIGRIILLTGSNMSGKSTFLRTVGINVCLAQAGAPVCATSFEWSWVRLYCCIRIDDSLEAGLSFFYAEVKRLKRLLDAAQQRSAPPVLFLIDEIFKGTNNRERLIGSRAFIRALAGSHGFGLITTHDLELAEIDKEIPTATNAHFQETVEANELRFDYRLRPGPCPTTNALRIMALEGLPVPGEGSN